MRAIQAREAGGPEVLELVDLPDPAPGHGEVLVRVGAAGVNFIDTYRRSGTYPMPFPHVVGTEGAGRVVALGEGVTQPAIGDRVAWSDVPGSYAELVAVPVDRALPVPDEVSDDVAAALPLQGMTAQYLVDATYPVQRGDQLLVHAAAGGVGLLLVQLAASRGARIIATVGSTEKETLARGAGADVVIRYDELDDVATALPALVREATGGEGVHAVYDGVGVATFDASLASLRRRGTLVLFGASSGPVPPVDPQRLNRAGSVYLTRPTLGDYTTTREELLARARDVFDAVAHGRLDVRIGARFGLADAAEAHRALEGRATTGKVLLEA
ncbi:Alcohol dehydrogenase zinc-binding domain protein [Beutenbergia cavernae DSM 12333]|uniref:Alcohol dehydrogenase zinc-binding domain protein n=1 Tax=Beutenbergia cavernae (strain ATCC BAA-8 / DSM 12333 / CCUG 43141 / JCM 11478 / NBRC 16432 / NCIMB 13614 / HKI 0122) TaxID=471853 RepID=C5BW23_BEUC1|nr:quinone oxidoreductase [Beutenbergia cavernae]ACQ80624.1 Alcohol dehydrogenase zinc-binding domain protein [Beutenbergia cavernae DSM 12333]